MRRLLALILSIGLAVPAQAEEQHLAAAGDIRIVHPWARAASAGGKTLVFMEVENVGVTDRLVGGETPLAETVYIVGLTLAGDSISVTEVGAVEIKPGQFDLDPGGLALELHGLTGDLVAGEHFDLVVTFETAGSIALEVAIEAADAARHSHAGHNH